jgi:hypothetical protein
MPSEYCLYLSTEPDSPVSRAIREKTECDWSHVGFYRIKDGWTFSAKLDDPEGVSWRPPNPNEKILKLSIDGIDAALSKALTQDGKPYDRLAIAGIALGKNWFTPGSFICSTLVAWAFEEIGVPLLNPTFIPREHITPRDILLSPYILEIK